MARRTSFVKASVDSPIFIVGLHRSGSTLWFNVTTANPEVFGIEEMHFLTPPWRRDFRYFLRTTVGNLSEEENVRAMVDLMFSGKRIPGIHGDFWYWEARNYDSPDLKERICGRIRASDRSLGSIFKALIEEMQCYQGFERCCVHFPVFVNYIPRLREWYPNGKIVHVTRDARAMAVSRACFKGERRLRNRRMTMLFAGLQYVWTSRLHRKYEGSENYALFRYEDLLADPEGTVRQLCDFAEIDFVPEMLEPRMGQASSITKKKSSGFNKIAATHWRRAISPLEERAITLLTRRSMERFGYGETNGADRLDR
jgi:hypothetical protein